MKSSGTRQMDAAKETRAFTHAFSRAARAVRTSAPRYIAQERCRQRGLNRPGEETIPGLGSDEELQSRTGREPGTDDERDAHPARLFANGRIRPQGAASPCRRRSVARRPPRGWVNGTTPIEKDSVSMRTSHSRASVATVSTRIASARDRAGQRRCPALKGR